MGGAENNIRMAVPLGDGTVVEAVWYGSGTLCVSCQAGCAAGCPFCASGAPGLFRSLQPEEMLRQISAARERGLRPARITVSGIGEPLHNAPAVLEFHRLCLQDGLPVSFTTIGSPLERLGDFLRLDHNGLMLSLHAGSPSLHRRLIPRGPEWGALWECLADAWPDLSRRRRRKIGINYLLLADINDAPREIGGLMERLRPYPEITVHLLSLNPTPDNPFRSPPAEAIDRVHARLAAEGIHVRRSNRWRRQAEGGCGTLLSRRGGFAAISP